jgi:Uma2 family endonuclease
MIVKRPTTVPSVEHVLLPSVSWQAYGQLLELMQSRRLRHTYIEGTLEIMSPLRRHEWIKTLLARMIELAAYELDMELEAIGSTTLRNEELGRGIEPDECYYVQHAVEMSHLKELDWDRDPPPDLAIEVNVTHSDLSRESVYAALGVPEIWHYDGDDDTLRILTCSGNRYTSAERSLAFPMLTPEALLRFLRRREVVSQRAVLKEFVAWIVEQHT